MVTGGSYSLTATVSGPGVTPTGTLTWTVTDPLGHAVPCADSVLDGAGQGTCTIASVIAGTYSGTASYGGDSNYNSSSGSDTTATVGKANSTTTMSNDAAGVKTGGSFTFTATVSGPGVTPTGTLTWTVTDPLGHTVICADSMLDGAGKGTCTILSAIAGVYSATASYGGDSNYNNSSVSDPTSTGTAASTTTVSDNAAGVVTGGSFTFTATVSGPGVTPTGTLTWTVTDPLAHVVTCANSTLNGAGQGTCTILSAIAGTYSATATYAGDVNYSGGSGSDTTATVGKGTPSVPTITNLPVGGGTLPVTGPGGGFMATVSTNRRRDHVGHLQLDRRVHGRRSDRDLCRCGHLLAHGPRGSGHRLRRRRRHRPDLHHLSHADQPPTDLEHSLQRHSSAAASWPR